MFRTVSVPKSNQRSGPLAGHVRKGRVYRSPLAATGALVVGDWFKDDLPDLLWPVLVFGEQGTDSFRRFVRWQKAVQDDLAGLAEGGFVAECLDGRLTNLVRLVEAVPEARDVLVRQARDHGLMSPVVARVLASYPFMPALWLTGFEEVSLPEQPQIDLLKKALIEVLRDEHREAVLKCFRIWSTVQAGTFRSDAATIDLLKTYPDDPAKRSQADTAVRAGWGAHKIAELARDPSRYDAALKWARVFWGANSMTSRCVRKREQEAEPLPKKEPMTEQRESDVTTAVPAEATPMPADGAHLRGLTLDLLASFVEALETAPARLHDSERQEVISGLVARAGRDLIAVLTAPDLWCMEHGSHVTRMLVETHIYLQWMAQQDPSIYRAYQEYGAGKAKLYARIVDEVPEQARRPGFSEAIAEFERFSHNHDVLDHRVVDTRDTFAEGKSIRVMAEECGLLDFYRQAYSLASGVAHSEWWSVETHAMEPCLNVLHGLHLIPSLSLNQGGNVELAQSWVDQFYSLVRIGLQILGTDEQAVAAAFAWLDNAQKGDEPA